MKRALLVSPYFIPSNLAGVHRVRLMATGLPEFGWEPTVLAVDPQHYGESLDPPLSALTPPVRIEHVQALGRRASRLVGLGDLSLRAFLPLRRRMRALLEQREVDLVFITVLPGYTGLLGAWAKRRFGVPFVLDYQDPWVSDWGATLPRFCKAALAHRLAEKIEPHFAPFADAVTAVSDGTLRSLRHRNLLASAKPVVAVPIGIDERDHEIAARQGKSVIEKKAGVFDLAYVGTLPERKLPTVRASLMALKHARELDPGARLRLHLVGTSGHARGTDVLGVGRMIKEAGLEESVRLEPARIPYLDALRTMQTADALFMLGSTEAHYTASKIFPYWLTGRPLIGLSHAQSSAHEIARQLGGIVLVPYEDETRLAPASQKLAELLVRLTQGRDGLVPPRNAEAFEPYSARGIGRTYANLFDNVMAARQRC